jgi:hypothetical protein
MDGPLKSAFDNLNSQGVVSHSLVTYRYLNGQLQKETVTRKYQQDGDYTDYSVVEPIGKGSSV